MPTMIYIHKETIDSYDELGPVVKHTRTPTIITDTGVMARQLSQVYEELVSTDEYDVRQWNDHGDEYFVEPAYAQGCYFLERMKAFQPLLEAFEMWKDRLSMPYTRDANGNWNWEPVSCWSATKFGGEEQAEAQKNYERNNTYVREALTKLRLNPRYPVRAVCWEHTEYIDREHRVKHSIHIVRDWMASDAQERTFREKKSDDETDAACDEFYNWSEQQARQQTKADLQTAMGEGGYTSYARNDDGTVTMWRD